MDPTVSYSIADLLNRARDNSPGEVDRLFTQARNYLRLIARSQIERHLQAKIDASDVVQQTLLDAHRDFPRFRGGTEGEWLAWLKQILSHNVANFVRHYRTGKRQVSREKPIARNDESTPGGVPEPAGGDESPSQAMVRKERELILADALAQLAPDHYEVIFLRNLQRMAFQDIAEKMGRSRPAVQMLWMRAVAKLQEILQGMQSAGISWRNGS